jgi:hypothetical protein
MLFFRNCNSFELLVAECNGNYNSRRQTAFFNVVETIIVLSMNVLGMKCSKDEMCAVSARLAGLLR